jgi:hypothetical protein
MGIFTGAVVALNQISTNGARAAIESRLMTKAILRCESKMAEVVAAIEPLQDVSETGFSDDPTWTWSVTTSDSPHAEVITVTVTVNFNGQASLSSTSYSMSRLIRDPIVFQISEEEAIE